VINLLIRLSLEKRLTVVVLALVTMALGVAVTLRMPVDVFPDLTAPTVTVLVEGHGLSPQEMETQVTFPIESAMNGASGVRRVRSGTALGVTVVWVEFEWGVDIQRARQTVAERLGTVAGAIPEGVEPPKLAPVSSVMGEILFISLTSPKHGPLELRTTATTLVRRRLLSVPGVSQVTPIGGDTKQYQVQLDPDRMRAYGITADEVLEALRASNENVAAGVLRMGEQEVLVEGIGRIVTLEDIGAVAIARREGVPVTVRDVATVSIGAAQKRGTAASSRRDENWKPVIEPGVVLAIQKQPGANTLELTKRLDTALDEIQSALPEGMLVHRNLFRQATFIQNAIDNTVTALVEGALFVVLVVAAFLASTRASVITLLALPLSLLITVLALEALDANINTMTLGGMAIAIGALVDDAIIDVEPKLAPRWPARASNSPASRVGAPEAPIPRQRGFPLSRCARARPRCAGPGVAGSTRRRGCRRSSAARTACLPRAARARCPGKWRRASSRGRRSPRRRARRGDHGLGWNAIYSSLAPRAPERFKSAMPSAAVAIAAPITPNRCRSVRRNMPTIVAASVARAMEYRKPSTAPDARNASGFMRCLPRVRSGAMLPRAARA